MVKLPKAIIKKYGISKKAWQVFRGRKGRKSSPKSTRRTKTMTRRKSRRRASHKVPIIPTIGAIVSIAVPADRHTAPMDAIRYAATGQWGPEGWRHALNDISAAYTGFDGRPEFPRWQIPWASVTILGSFLVSKGLGWLGLNRVFSRAPSPLNKLKF